MTETPWAQAGMVGFDLETTGVDPATARIMTASTVYVRPGQPPTTRDWLADPGCEIPAEATAVHSITTEHARTHGRPHAEVVNDAISTLLGYARDGVPLVIFNAPYDLTVLDRRAVEHGQPTLIATALDLRLPVLIIDPLVIDRRMDPYRKGPRKLTHLCQQVYDIPLTDSEAHGSAADALAACRLAWRLAQRYPQVGRMSLGELHDNQVRWYAEWATKFRAYLEGQGKPVTDLGTVWPGGAGPSDGLFDPPPTSPRHGLL